MGMLNKKKYSQSSFFMYAVSSNIPPTHIRIKAIYPARTVLLVDRIESSYNILPTKLDFPMPLYPVTRYEPLFVFSSVNHEYKRFEFRSLPINFESTISSDEALWK